MTTWYTQSRLEKELFRACEAGIIDGVRRAIAAGVDPKKAINKDVFPEETPLHTACRYVIIPSEVQETLDSNTRSQNDGQTDLQNTRI